jgi:hypothetical protein
MKIIITIILLCSLHRVCNSLNRLKKKKNQVHIKIGLHYKRIAVTPDESAKFLACLQ